MGSQFQQELACLLQNRLRVVTLIVLFPTLLFLLRSQFDSQRQPLMDPVGFWLHAGMTMLTGVLAMIVWVRPDLPLRGLRHLELALFVSLIAFFGWLQFRLIHTVKLTELSTPETASTLTRLAIECSAIRWFFLIVIYGVFIPNTWKRCALLTGCAAILPLVLTLLGAWHYDHSTFAVGQGLLDLTILMLTAWVVAVFGAYRLQILQQQAFQARRLGQYQLRRKLGSGGMGEVYEAEHVLLRRRCAIKLVHPDKAGDPATLARFEREVRAMATLTHWNTTEIYDYGHADDGTFYYVMEYLNGMTLESLVLRHGPVVPARAIHFLRQVCRALHEAHAIGLLHRDIKPSNLMSCKRGGMHDVIKILDFGLVQQTRPDAEALKLTVQGAILGSPPYMSPEQAAGRQDLDARADIYALGGVGYFLLTGQPPFVRETAMELMLAHAYEQVIPPSRIRPEVPTDLEAVLLRCLNKKPDDRYPDVDSLEKALARCADADSWTEEQASLWWQFVAVRQDTLTPEEITVVAT